MNAIISKEERDTIYGGVQFLLLSNDVLCSKVLDLVSELRKCHHLYRHNIKHDVNMLDNARKMYEAKVRMAIYNRYSFDLSISEASQRMEDDINTFYIQSLYTMYNDFASKMKNMDTEYISIMSHIVLVRFFCKSIQDTFDMIKKIARKNGIGIYALNSDRISLIFLPCPNNAPTV